MHAVYLRAPHLYDGDQRRSCLDARQHQPQATLFFRCFGRRGRVCLPSPIETEEDKAAISDAHARTMFNECMGQEVDIEIISRSSWTAGLTLVAERMSERRIFIAGDAAHLFTPTGGLGYNTAIEDVVNLGWKLAAVINGGVDPDY